MSSIFYSERYGRKEWSVLSIFLALFAGVAAFAAVLVFAIVGISRSVGRTTCANWSDSTGRETKFVVLNAVDAGTCLTLAPDGRWIKNTQVVQFVGKDGK